MNKKQIFTPSSHWDWVCLLLGPTLAYPDWYTPVTWLSENKLLHCKCIAKEGGQWLINNPKRLFTSGVSQGKYGGRGNKAASSSVMLIYELPMLWSLPANIHLVIRQPSLKHKLHPQFDNQGQQPPCLSLIVTFWNLFSAYSFQSIPSQSSEIFKQYWTSKQKAKGSFQPF